jgi:predicted nuclease of restriction endonuclease-like (RecB) superfamily
MSEKGQVCKSMFSVQNMTKAFPDMRGFRARNLKYMRAFAEAYPDKEFVQQVVAQLPWGHQVRILDT